MRQQHIEEIENKIFGELPFKAKAKDIKLIIEYAKEQTKRVQELEKEINETKDKWNIDAAKWMIVIGGLKEQNKRYREVLENIRTVKYDDEFNPYAYMMLEIIEWAEEALEGEE